jgi:signal transduction histidine kinase
MPAPALSRDPLTNASDVLALSGKEALSAIPVVVRGVVTAAQTNWSGRFFIQDESGGVFVDNLKSPQPLPGDVVEVRGVSHPGGYAPTVTKPQWKKLGTAALPEAKVVTMERLMSGTEDSQRVEISGVIRTARWSGSLLEIELAAEGERIHAYAALSQDTQPQSLVGAKVRLRGTAATSFNAPLRQFVNVTLYIPRAEDFIVEQAAINPFDEPLTPLNSIAQYHRTRSPGNQVHIKGVVTYQRKGEDFFIQDGTGALQVKTKQPGSLGVGEVIEVVGFPAVKNLHPVLEDAIFRELDQPRVEVKPTRGATVGGFQLGLHHAEFVIIRGRLIDRMIKGVGQSGVTPVFRTTLVLQTTNFFFVAEKDTSDQNSMLGSIPLGSLVEASGVCLLESGEDAKSRSLRLLLPTSYNVRIIQKPSWFTPEHLQVTLVMISVVLVVAVGWTALLSKKNLMLKFLMREKEAAQQELQQAHDLLEERVKERTNQLRVEMTARKESELQFRAVLTERTRLAQELHDTLEQSMTGIALQLDLTSSLFDEKSPDASHHLQLARNLMQQSQTEVRRSVWGLRSRATEPFNLVNALNTTTRQITDNTGICVEVQTHGEAGPLSEIAEENLLRIGQEAVTNVVKHSGAKVIQIDLQFTPQRVALQIKDDGKGFAPADCVGPKDGHFGLLGIRERAERLGGQALITSEPGKGSRIRVEIPTHPPDSDSPFAAASPDP